jgi:hypothetical protein
MIILKKNRNTKTYKMIKIQTITVVIQNVPVAHAHTITESLPVKRPH